MSLFPDYRLLALALAVLVLAVLLHRQRGMRRGLALARRLVLAMLLVVVAARPVVGTSTATTYSAGVDVVIMIDRTTSMAAEDYAGGQMRLQGVKDDIAKLIASVQGSRIAIVVFDNNARVALPFTTDAAAAVSLADAIGWREATYGVGSDISIGVPTARALLERSKAERPNTGRYLVYFGDGEQTVDTPPASFAELQPLVNGGLVLGYGTTTGGPMKEYQGANTYVMKDGQRALSVIDEANLQRIAQQLQVPYEHRTSGTGLSLSLAKSVYVPTVRHEPRGFELYWIAAGVAVFVLGLELWDDIGRLRRAKSEVL